MEPVRIEEEGIVQEITIEEIAELHEELLEGKPCICVSCSFRAAKLAFSKLWREETPKREDIEIISALPTGGSQQTFKSILGIEPLSNAGGEFELCIPEGTDVKNLMLQNYTFTFTRKSTGAAIRVQTRQEIFSDGFFEQRGIVEFGIPREATEEERARFERREREVRDKFLTFSEEELFISKDSEK